MPCKCARNRVAICIQKTLFILKICFEEVDLILLAAMTGAFAKYQTIGGQYCNSKINRELNQAQQLMLLE
jgi:hypothetical protein